MLGRTTLALAVSLGFAAALPTLQPQRRQENGVPGFDVSHYQGAVDMQTQANNGAQFVIIKATEGTSTTDSEFSNNYNAATQAGLIRGGYHFAHPDESDGATQANFFLQNGGGWSGDGQTLPGALDIEYNPNGDTCYGLGASNMVQWISDFVNTYQSATGVYPMIYTTNNWWSECTDNASDFSQTCPLWLARYSSSVGTIPGGWGYQTFWQFSDQQSPYPGDQDSFNGSQQDLQNLATNG